MKKILYTIKCFCIDGEIVVQFGAWDDAMNFIIDAQEHIKMEMFEIL